jgi:hypothetical protein
MNSSAVWRFIAIVTVMTLGFIGTANAQATVVKSLIVVNANGTQVGPFGYSDSVEQGVVVNLLQVLGQGNFDLWVLVPFGVSGVPENCPMNDGCTAATTGAYRYYAGTSCQGAAYLVVTSDILSNSRNNPYSLGPGANEEFYGPSGTPQSGTVLGIASRNYYDQFGELETNSCSPAWISSKEMFAPLTPFGIRGALGSGPFSLKAVP